MARIEVLLRERAGYVARGLADRIAQVDAVLASMGYQQPGRTGRDSGSAGHAETAVQATEVQASSSLTVETAALETVDDGTPARAGRRGGQRRVERG